MPPAPSNRKTAKHSSRLRSHAPLHLIAFFILECFFGNEKTVSFYHIRKTRQYDTHRWLPNSVTCSSLNSSLYNLGNLRLFCKSLKRFPTLSLEPRLNIVDLKQALSAASHSPSGHCSLSGLVLPLGCWLVLPRGCPPHFLAARSRVRARVWAGGAWIRVSDVDSRFSLRECRTSVSQNSLKIHMYMANRRLQSVVYPCFCLDMHRRVE